MILKPDKYAEDVKPNRPISLLPIPFKDMDILLFKRLMPIVHQLNQLRTTSGRPPDNQFGFWRKHSTIEQIYGLIKNIHSTFEQKKYCSVFLDKSQIFHRIWHKGLLFKIKTLLPINYYTFVRSYLTDRHFLVKQGEAMTNLHKIQAGVPQGNIMGPTLYLPYTADLPVAEGTVTGAFADDTAVMAVGEHFNRASSKLQKNLWFA